MTSEKRAHSFEKKRRFSKGRKRNNENNEVQRVAQEQLSAESLDVSSLKKFTDFPLSSKTLRGLKEGDYMEPTEIQRDSIPLALSGRDILGAAKTGSGKTLAFLIPVLETLWKEKFASYDGLGALIISPTRELAYQTFEVLRKIGCYHDMSAGLVIGGKELKSEQMRISKTNIIVCTPGRLLQHMDETPNFTSDNLKMLVLDEADRILDLGFAETMNSILENLPVDRQTLLFSATQTKSVKDLARLSLSEPSYVSTHEHSEFSTPQRLLQSYVVCELHQKINFLFSFLRNHTKCKILIFMSSCKQVKFVYEAFKKIRPGIPLMALYGKQKQLKRVAIYDDFCQRSAAALLATDIAARGLDFPGINWVIQLDCPEDVNTYIHRAGRTARYEKDGQALLILLPNEESEMVKNLKDRKIPIEEIRTNPKKLQDIQKKLSSLCAENQELKHWAQRSIVSYVRSVFLQTNKKVFDIHKLNVEQYASSLGLLAPPRIRFMKKLEKRITDVKEKERDLLVNSIMKDMGMSPENDPISNEKDEKQTKINKLKNKSKVETKIQLKVSDKIVDESERDTDDILVTKESNLTHLIIGDEEIVPELSTQEEIPKRSRRTLTKTALAKKIVRKGIQMNTKVVFDDSGEVLETHGVILEKEKPGDDVTPINILTSKGLEVGGINIEEHRKLMKAEDKLDRKRERERVKDKHKKERQKRKQERRAMSKGVSVAELATLEPVVAENENNGSLVSASESESEADNEIDGNEPSKKIGPTPRKRQKVVKQTMEVSSMDANKESTLLDDEELALQLLTGSS